MAKIRINTALFKKMKYPSPNRFRKIPDTLLIVANFANRQNPSNGLKLTFASLRVYAALCVFWIKEGRPAYPTLQTIADITNLGRSVVSHHLRVLNCAGYIARKYYVFNRRERLDPPASCNKYGIFESYEAAQLRAETLSKKMHENFEWTFILFRPEEPTLDALIRRGYLTQEWAELENDTPPLPEQAEGFPPKKTPPSSHASTGHNVGSDHKEIKEKGKLYNQNIDSDSVNTNSAVVPYSYHQYFLGCDFSEFESRYQDDFQFLDTGMSLATLRGCKTYDDFKKLLLENSSLTELSIERINYFLLKATHEGIPIDPELIASVRMYCQINSEEHLPERDLNEILFAFEIDPAPAESRLQ